MFAAGDLVVYGGEGVCRVQGIGAPTISGADKAKLYYTLAPMGRTGQVLTPVDTKVLMRPVISRQEADALIEDLQELEIEKPGNTSMRGMKEYYRTVVMSYDCRHMASLIKGICRKRKWALAHGKKVSQMDERYLKRAEDQFYGELGIALGLAKEDVPDYIRQICPGWPEE